MFCYVKYLCDGEKAIVPSSFVKEFKKNFVENETYEVFWSPNSEDTPQSILLTQGKILTIDKETEVKGLKRSVAPLPGYYFARILIVADTEEELENHLNSKSGRRIKNEDMLQRKEKVKKASDAVKLGKRKSTENLIKDAPKISSVFSDSDGDDSFISMKIHKSEIAEFKKTNKLLKIKNNDLKSEINVLKSRFNEIYQLNIELQKKILNIPLKAPDVISSPLLSEEFEPTTHYIESVPDLSYMLPTPELTDEMETLEEEQFLEEDHLARITFRVKPGASGDSMFIKNISLAVFGEEILRASSVTGLKCNAKKDSAAKPPLCAKRLEYIKKLFKKRIELEVPMCGEEEKAKRLSKMNSFVADKILTLCRKK